MQIEKVMQHQTLPRPARSIRRSLAECLLYGNSCQNQALSEALAHCVQTCNAAVVVAIGEIDGVPA
jgi:hypothetical protein